MPTPSMVSLLTLGALILGYQDRPERTASVQGQVVDATGAPLNDAVVVLRRVHEVRSQGEDLQIVQHTEAEGRFVFRNVPKGDWELLAEKRGFSLGKYGASRYVRQGSRISVKGDEEINDIIVRLAREAVIAGRVLDVEGGPVEGVRVAALKVAYSKGVPHWSEVASTTTADNGEYRIPRLRAGQYLVKCGAMTVESLGVEETYPATYYPNLAEASLASAINVRDDSTEIKSVDIVLAPVRVFHIRGKVSPPSGSQSGARVLLLERSDPSRVLASCAAMPPDYLIDFSRIPPGEYIIFTSSMDATGLSARQLVELRAQNIENVVLSVNAEEIPGRVKSGTGDRWVDLSAISVRIRPIWLDGTESGHAVSRAVSLSTGLAFRYRMEDVFFASFAVSVSNIPEGCYVASIQYGGKEVPEAGVEFLSGATLEITIASDGATVDGRTIDKDDKPREGAVVALIPADGNGTRRSLRSGPGGTFHLSGVPPGEYKLLAWEDVSEDDIENPNFVKRFQSQATPVNVPANGSTGVSVRVLAADTIR